MFKHFVLVPNASQLKSIPGNETSGKSKAGNSTPAAPLKKKTGSDQKIQKEIPRSRSAKPSSSRRSYSSSDSHSRSPSPRRRYEKSVLVF